MAYRLGIDLGESLTLAAYLADREVRLLPLGEGAAALPTVAHVKALGGVTAGEAARAASQTEPAGFVEQPLALLARSSQVDLNGQRITGEVLVARILESVLASAVARFGSRPERTVISHPASFEGNSNVNLLAAASRSGLTNVSLIPVDEATTIATTVAGEGSGIAADFLGAYGAAVLASKALDDGLELTQPVPMPLVTIEDIDGVVPEPRNREPVIDSIYEPKGPATVFTEEEEASQRPASVAPVAQAPLPQSPVASQPLPPSRAGWYTAIGLVGVAVIAAATYLLFFVDAGAGTTAASGSSSVPVSASSSSTVATTSTTTVPPTTTSAPTTTAAPTTTMTTTTTTTTTLPELARPGLLALNGRGLVLEPGTGAESNLTFGFDADAAIGRVSAIAGTPDTDTGWIADEFCSAPEVRIVIIGDLELIFAGDAADGSGKRTFEQWFVSGNERRRPANLVARLGAGVGVTIADMEAIYGDRFDAKDGTSSDGRRFFQLEDGGPISGSITGLESDDTITNLSAGLTCDLGGE